MKHDIRRTVCGPMEWELRISHRYEDEIFHYCDQLDDISKDLKHLVEYGKSAIIEFALNKWYREHGNGD